MTARKAGRPTAIPSELFSIASGHLGPIGATEIEVQTVRWIAELIGFPSDAGGLLVSGGNMANFVGLLAARAAKAGWDVRTAGIHPAQPRRIMTSRQPDNTAHRLAHRLLQHHGFSQRLWLHKIL